MIIVRKHYEKYTKGIMVVENEYFATLELPWNDNERNISAIPEGEYVTSKFTSNKFGPCFAVKGVPNRSLIRIHVGNFTSQIRGCILVGKEHKDINLDGIIDVVKSRDTINRLYKILPNSFLCKIINI